MYYYFFWNLDSAPPGLGALLKLRTLYIGSGGTDCYRPQYRSYRTDRTARAL